MLPKIEPMTASTSGATATTANPVPLRQDARTIGLIGLAHGSSHFFHMLLPPLFPWLIGEFGFSYSELGLLVSVFFVISGVGQALSGFLVDRVGARPVMFFALSSFAAAGLAAGTAQGYTGLLLAAALAGLGNAPFHPVDFSILNQRVSTHRLGYAFSAHGLSGNLGWALTPVFLLFFTAWQGWRSGYLAAAVLYACILAVLVLHRGHLKTEVVRRAHDSPQGSDVAFLRLPVVWWCFAFFLLSTMTLAVVQASVLARWTRSAVLDVMREDFVRTARAKGLSHRATLWGHVLRNAMIPVITVMGLQFAELLAGTIVVENVFYLPGLGRLIFQSIANRDLVVVRNCVMLLAAMVVLVNFVVDLLYAAIDPRVKVHGL